MFKKTSFYLFVFNFLSIPKFYLICFTFFCFFKIPFNFLLYFLIFFFFGFICFLFNFSFSYTTTGDTLWPNCINVGHCNDRIGEKDRCETTLHISAVDLTSIDDRTIQKHTVERCDKRKSPMRNISVNRLDEKNVQTGNHDSNCIRNHEIHNACKFPKKRSFVNEMNRNALVISLNEREMPITSQRQANLLLTMPRGSLDSYSINKMSGSSQSLRSGNSKQDWNANERLRSR